MADCAPFLKTTTADGRDLEQLKAGYSLLTILNYDIDKFEEIFQHFRDAYADKIVLVPFNTDEGDKHGAFYTNDEIDYGITTLYYKLLDENWSLTQVELGYGKTRVEHTPLQGSLGFEIGTLLADRWMPTDTRVLEVQYVMDQLADKLASSKHEFTDVFRLKNEKAHGWKLFMANQASEIELDVQRWFTDGAITNLVGDTYALYTESMASRFYADQENLELKRQKMKFTIFGLGIVQDGSREKCKSAISSAFEGIIDRIESASKRSVTRKRAASDIDVVKWPKSFDKSKLKVELSDMTGTDKNGQFWNKTFGWVFMPDELYRDLPKSRFICSIAGYRNASIKPYMSKEMREQDKVEKMSGSNLNTWARKQERTPTAQLNFQRAGTAGSAAPVHQGSNGGLPSSSLQLSGSNVEQQVQATLKDLQGLRNRMLEVEKSTVKKAQVGTLVRTEFKAIAKKFTTVMESFQKEMKRIQDQLDECVTFSTGLEQHFKTRGLDEDKEAEQVAGWKTMGMDDEMIAKLLAQTKQLVQAQGKEDASKMAELGQKLQVGQQNLREVRAIASEHITQMKDAAQASTNGVAMEDLTLDDDKEEDGNPSPQKRVRKGGPNPDMATTPPQTK